MLSDRDGGAILPRDQWFPRAASSAFGTEGALHGAEVFGGELCMILVPSLGILGVPFKLGPPDAL